MLFDFSRVFEYDYIFEYLPSWNPKISYYNFIIFGAIFVLGIFFSLLKNSRLIKERHFWQVATAKFTPLCYTAGSIGVVLFFFRYQAIPYLSSRFLVYLLIAVIFLWIIYILWYFLKSYPKEAKYFRIQSRINRYIPTRKKR